MTDFGTLGTGTLQPGEGEFEEQITFTGVTQNANGTATLTGVKTAIFISPYTQSSGLAKTHAGSTIFVISNTAVHYDGFTNKNDEETIVNVWTFNATASGANPIIDDDDYVPSDDDYIVKKYATTQLPLDSTFVTNLTNNPAFQADVNNFISTGGGGGGGGGGKPMSFSFVTGDASADPLMGYQDREAFVYASSIGTAFKLQDAVGNIQSRTVTTDWADADSVQSFVLIGNNLYLLLKQNATEYRVYLYDASDLSLGGTLCTFSGATLNYETTVKMTSNGTDIFFNFDAGNSSDAFDIAKFSVSGTVLTYVATVTCGSTASQFSGTFAVDDSENYYGVDNGIFYQYDSSGVLQYTSGSLSADVNQIINWSNTLYGAESTGDHFVKLYLPDTTLVEGIVSRTTSVSSVAILDLNNTPVEIIPAPGAGKAIRLIALTGQLTFVTTPYATNTDLDIIYAGEAAEVMQNTTLLPAAATLIDQFTAGAQSTILANTAVQVTNLSGNPSAGDGTLKLYAVYEIIKL